MGIIYTINADGSSEKRLTEKPGSYIDVNHKRQTWFMDYRDPTWSPDSKWIGFLRATNGPHITFLDVASADGATNREFTKTCGDSIGAFEGWSSDSRRLFFTCDHYSKYGPFSIGVDGRGLRLASDPELHNADLVWSPNRSRAFFYRCADEDQEERCAIYTTWAGESHARRITPFTSRATVRRDHVTRYTKSRTHRIETDYSNLAWIDGGSRIAYYFYKYNYSPPEF